MKNICFLTISEVNGKKNFDAEYKNQKYEIHLISEGLIKRCKNCKKICLVLYYKICCICHKCKKNCLLCSLRGV